MALAYAVFTRIAALHIGAFGLMAGSTAKIHAAECQAQLHYDNHPEGKLVITEYAFGYVRSNCPTERISSDRPIEIGHGTKLYTWIRLQGDVAYLSRGQSRHSLRASFYLDNNGIWVYQKALPLGELNIPQVIAEAKSFGGIFDWRVFAEKWSFEIPGDYAIWIEQDDEVVCPIARSGDACSLKFRVEHPK